MSELDRFFGPRSSPPPDPGPRMTPDELLLAAIRHRSDWHCEERLKPALAAFFECWPELMPRSQLLRRQHYQAMRPVLEEIGEARAPEFIHWCAREIGREVTVKTGRSLLFLIGRWRKQEPGMNLTPYGKPGDRFGLCAACHSLPCTCEDES